MIKKIDTDMGLFDYTIRCLIGPHDEALKRISSLYDDSPDELLELSGGNVPRGACYHRDGVVPIIWIPRRPRTPGEYGTLAHECLHAVMHLFRWAGMVVSDDTEEVVTHSVGHLMSNILEKTRND